MGLLNGTFVRRALGGMLAIACAAGATGAYAQAPDELSEQTLDRIDVIELQGATNVALDINVPTAIKPWVATDYPAVSGTAFKTCVNTATRGLICNDNNEFRHWPNPEKLPPLAPEDGRVLFSCANPVFGFDKLCSGFAMGIDGSMWVAGPNKSKFSLFKVLKGTCPPNSGTSFTTPAGTFCARLFASGRPSPLTNLTVVDGTTAEAFPYSEGGVIAVEGKGVTFFRNVPLATPVVFVPSNLLPLSGGDQLQAVTLLQKALPVNSRNWLVMTTLNGKLLSREIPSAAPPTTPIINHANQVSIVSPTPCPLQTAFYDAQWSQKTHATIVSDRRGCRLMSMLSNIDSPSFTSTTPLAFSSLQVIASTTPSSSQIATLTAPPEGVSIAPGVEVDLRADCGFDTNGNPLECGIVPDGSDPNDFAAAASLKGVKIDANTLSGLTVFHVPTSQDCRYTPFAQQSAQCKNGAIVAPDGRVIDDPNDPTEYAPDGMPLHPELLYLDVGRLVPEEATQGVILPRMWMGPRYKALDDTNTFGMVIGETDDGVRFRETFLANFHLQDLIPAKLGCGGDTVIDLVNGPQWDALLTISEDYTDPGDAPGGGFQHTHTLVNGPGCDDLDPPAAGTRWSAYLYGVHLAKEQVPNRTNPSLIEVRYPDSIFGRLVLSLFRDFGELIDDYLCVDRDGGTGAPISASACTTLQESFDNTYDKLSKCVSSATEPMNPSGIRTCQGFESQYLQFAAQVNGLTPASLDPANRVGGAIARLINWRYMYDTQYLPSIPAETGFIDGL